VRSSSATIFQAVGLAAVERRVAEDLALDRAGDRVVDAASDECGDRGQRDTENNHQTPF
jgi:hypothetical protein